MGTQMIIIMIFYIFRKFWATGRNGGGEILLTSYTGKL
jgi:hypothetical protein